MEIIEMTKERGRVKLMRRQIKLIRIIYENPQWTLKDISKKLDVSLQTLKSDLQQLREPMQPYHVMISVLPGNQIRLLGQENVNYMLKEFQSMQDFSLEKQAYLLLLLKDKFMVLQDMADVLFVSKSLMEKVMSVMLKKYPDEIESVRHHGIRIISSQMERRNAFGELIMPYLKGVDFQKELESFHENHFPILDYVDREAVGDAVQAVQKIRSSRAFHFTDESIIMLFLQMIYIVSCYRNWEHVMHETLVENMIDGIRDAEIYRETALETCRILKIPETEASYFSYLFLMLRKQSMSDTDFYLKEMHGVLQKIMDRIQERTAIDFHGDHVLWQGLAVHIYTTVIRKDKLKTSFFEQEGEGIRQEYPIGLEMAVVAAEVIQEELSYTVSQEEIVYLTLHFQAAIERMVNFGHDLRIIVVCHYGMAAASLISARLERVRAGIKVVDSLSMQAFLERKELDADLVVSTESIQPREGMPPIIYVTPMLPDRELKEIRQFAELHCFHNIMMVYIMKAQILTMEAESKEEVLERCAGHLEEQGYATDAYLTSLLEREKMSSTDLDAIAVPHGNPDYVTQTQLLIVRLKKPVFWGVSDVQYVFLFAVKREDFRERFALITQFYKRMSRPSLRAGLQSCKDMDDNEFRLSFMHMMGN